MKKAAAIAVLSMALMSGSYVFAESAPGSALSVPGYFGSINNNTTYVVECSQVIGGYCANNPMPANGYLQMLPDPGSHMIKGHIMVFDKNVPGKYVDNVVFTYKEGKNGEWSFIAPQTKNLYDKGVKISIVPGFSDTLIINQIVGK
ncbi:hypothetical protein [Cysteiniphilum halobium]|uniref:hypothetical protein n=1 Tax=Cysteiniphilum halobium TaxID=2219059 RepID=UPI000E651D72|nr:hypothetical protein [Cysteiniphilum halobium]